MAFGQFLETLWKSSESGRRSSENRQKASLVRLYYKQNNTWLLVDMEYLHAPMCYPLSKYIVPHYRRGSRILKWGGGGWIRKKKERRGFRKRGDRVG